MTRANRTRASTILLAVTVSAAVGACRPRVDDSWRVVDLLALTPKIEGRATDGRAPWRRATATLGSSQVRVPAGAVRGLEQAGGTSLRWVFGRGDDTVVRVVPLAADSIDGDCSYRLSAEGASDRSVILAEGKAHAATRAPSIVEARIPGDLGSRIEVVFTVEGRCRMLWGSPTIAFRNAAVQPGSLDPERPNLILVTADTLRADAVGPWRTEGSITPALDRLAASSDVFLEAYATFNSTNPSFASVMTGLYGKDHGIYDLTTPLPEVHRTLADELTAAGYATDAIVSASHLAPRLGQGFDRILSPEGQFSAEMAIDTAIGWVDAHRGPFFLWLHLFDPHTPHSPPAPFALGQVASRASGIAPTETLEEFRSNGLVDYSEPVLGGHTDLYQSEVAYLDRQLDRFFDFVESRGLFETSVVAFVSDHGENLGDHGVDFRHNGLWKTTLHVPLMIRWPGRKRTGRRIDGLVQHLDLFPTLLRAVGLEVPDQDGIDLGRLASQDPPGRPWVYAEAANGYGASVRSRRYAYSEIAGDPLVPDGPKLFDLVTDPDELDDVSGLGLPEESALAAALERFLAARRPAIEVDRPPVGEAEREQLEALGYN